MVYLDVFSKNIQKTYKSPLISKATLLVLVLGIFSVVIPFILAYKSKGLWLKRDVFYEQPNVKFKGEYIFVATTTNSSAPITCSTIPFYQEALEFLDYCDSIKVREEDRNFDRKIDELSLRLEISLPEKTFLTSLSIIIPLDYKLHSDQCRFQMQSAVIYQEFLPIPLIEFSVHGDLNMVQSVPLRCYKNVVNSAYNYSIISKENDINSYRISNIINDYSTRNVSTKLANIYTSFMTGSNQQFELNLKIRYPEDQIRYRPGFWQIIKWAWIQYLAIYVAVSWLTTKLKLYLFNRRLLLFYVDDPVKKRQ